MHIRIIRAIGLVGAIALTVGCAVAATPDPVGKDVWSHAAKRSGVSVQVLYGIALTESGRKWSDGKFRPWPWTLNSPTAGSQFFASREAAEVGLLKLIGTGEKNIDIGLMQINYGYHRQRVDDPRKLLDAATNIRVASEILAEVHVATSDVAKAVGAYHAGLHPKQPARSKWYQDTVAQNVRKLLKGTA